MRNKSHKGYLYQRLISRTNSAFCSGEICTPELCINGKCGIQNGQITCACNKGYTKNNEGVCEAQGKIEIAEKLG